MTAAATTGRRRGPGGQAAARSPRTHELLAAHMRREGLKHSRQRDVVVEVFLASRGHVTVEELGARVREREAGIGQTTVYRALKLLVDCGLATTHRFGAGETRYEPVRPGTHHDHLVCTACGAIEEFEDEAIEQLQAAAAHRHGFVLDGHVFELYGRCRRCRGQHGRSK